MKFKNLSLKNSNYPHTNKKKISIFGQFTYKLL